MRKVLLSVLAAASLVAAGTVAAKRADAAKPAPVQVMVLGVYHLDNPGLDLRNITADDPTSPRRQRELEALADALVRFKPTKVMIEVQGAGPDFEDKGYRSFTPANLATDRNEVVQIGYRLAHRAGLKSVQAIDEQPGPGEPDYFPFDKVQAWTKANGKEAQLGAMFALVEQEQKEFERLQPVSSIPALLMRHNGPGADAMNHALYNGLLWMGDGESQPGAELNAYWFMRNAKIFGKLMLASKPGDRVLVIYGSGHRYWLRQLAKTTPGFVDVDVMPYLKDAARRARP
ncbi:MULTISPECIES: DUF5694 domain-containing protein [unclassified Novosphingobium]|uniref:DUF5694 domain-containing protein n=1 Tax=unclassified Novosphingobium TaxID=2644732 RepID=UPI0025D31EFF|nr:MULTISPECIES: DUF5694 domain-containing protein [unclassified Novosphingobium]HQV02973.1 DUF5694 domain-containing protein [Novosphingobium sp.]